MGGMYLPAFKTERRYPDSLLDMPSCCAWRIMTLVGKKTPQKKMELPSATRRKGGSLNGARNWLRATGVGWGGSRETDRYVADDELS